MTEKEFNQCVAEYADNVYRFVLKNLRNEEDAKDIVQGAFEKLWVNRKKVESEKSRSYLFTVAYHQLIDHVRKGSRMTFKEDLSGAKLITTQTQPDLKKLLNEALYKLNEMQRSLVLLKDYEGYNYEEITQITSLSLSQVKVYLHRARIQLKNYLVKPENII